MFSPSSSLFFLCLPRLTQARTQLYAFLHIFFETFADKFGNSCASLPSAFASYHRSPLFPSCNTASSTSPARATQDATSPSLPITSSSRTPGLTSTLPFFLPFPRNDAQFLPRRTGYKKINLVSTLIGNGLYDLSLLPPSLFSPH